MADPHVHQRRNLVDSSLLLTHFDTFPPPAPGSIQICALDGCEAKGTKVCSRCRLVHYCSPEHQRADWKAGHKMICVSCDGAPAAPTKTGGAASSRGNKKKKKGAKAKAKGTQAKAASGPRRPLLEMDRRLAENPQFDYLLTSNPKSDYGLQLMNSTAQLMFKMAREEAASTDPEVSQSVSRVPFLDLHTIHRASGLPGPHHPGVGSP